MNPTPDTRRVLADALLDAELELRAAQKELPTGTDQARERYRRAVEAHRNVTEHSTELLATLAREGNH